MNQAETLKTEILKRWPRTSVDIERREGMQPRLAVYTDHGKVDRIGQFALAHYGQIVETYFACHEFRKAHLSIYLKR